MAVIINIDGYEFLECISLNENELNGYSSLAGSYAVIQFDSKYLLCFNTYRQQWEVPAGGRNHNETTKECAIRELYEETGQIVNDMEFRGLVKIRKPDGKIKYNPIYYAIIDKLVPFKENSETDKILFWDSIDNIGYIDAVDVAVLSWCDALNSNGKQLAPRQ